MDENGNQEIISDEKKYKNLYCDNPKCRHLVGKADTEEKGKIEIKCPKCGWINHFAFVVIKK